MNIAPTDCLLTSLDRFALYGALPKGAIGIEVGVNRGGNAKRILKNAAPSRLHLIDPWPTDPADEYLSSYRVQYSMEECYSQVRSELRAQIEAGQVVIHRAYSHECIDAFAAESVDFVYVDAMHSYDGCLQDLELFAPKLKQTGLLMGHDFSNTASGRKKNFGVLKAVVDFVGRGRYAPVLVTMESAPSYVLAQNDTIRRDLILNVLARGPGVLADFATLARLEQSRVVLPNDKPAEIIRLACATN